ncbi:NAD(P)H dehydrogenase (quinone) [Burkholderiales bacterium]|nr:NAD(P)H dehydrogenase (quinone) [Burkholderiales bacterium]
MLLIVHHTQFGATAQLARAAIEGARGAGAVEVRARLAHEAGVEDMLAARGYLIGTSENFGGIAGMVKDFLERVYYPCEGRIEGRPWSAFVCASNDGAGAMTGLERIAAGLRLRKVHPGFIYRSGVVAQRHEVPASALAQARDLGATLAAGLDAGLY